MNRLTAWRTATTLMSLAACRDEGPVAPPDAAGVRPGFLISDAVHQAGVPQFYWLPPTVPNPGPSVTGIFDDGLLGGPGAYPQLEVRICPAGIAAICPSSGAGSFRSFNAYGTVPAITKHQANENYQLLWNKNGLAAGNSYRAWALVRTAETATPIALGFADVMVVSNSKALKQVNTDTYVGLIAGNPLYLKFTVRTGIPGAIAVALGTSVLTPGASTTATATVTDLHGVALAGATIAWGVTPGSPAPGTIAPDDTPSTTDATGSATATLTAGGSAGSGSVTATVGTSPGQLSGSAEFTVVTAGGLVVGGNHTCAIANTGVAYCWGQNIWGELGIGAVGSSPTPVAVALPDGVSGFTRLAAGAGHTCALTPASSVYCWGNDEFQQLGYDGSSTDSPVPVPTSVGIAPPFSQFVATGAHTCLLGGTGSIYCWGDLGAPQTGYASVTAGGLHNCGLTLGGIARCWGSNVYGQLGDGTDDNAFVTPVDVSLPGGVAGFTSLAAGGIHTCALTAAGAAWCWGSNNSGQLGTTVSPNSEVPVPVELPAGVALASLTSGHSHTCGLTAAGAAYCWGQNGDGQLGNNSTLDSPAAVAVLLPTGVTGFTRIVAGGQHTCAISSAGAAYCWGNNDDGQVGDNSTSDRLTPQLVSGGLQFPAP